VEAGDKFKAFLQKKITELREEISQLKRKNLVIQVMQGGLLIISITSATVVSVIAPLGIAPLIIACVASISSISTVLSMKFNLKKKKEKLSCAIRQLNISKDKLGYVVSCNGSMTEDECNNILKEFR
jgi:hypothetical protein